MNIDALGAVVAGHGREIGEIREQISSLGDRMGIAIQALSNKMDSQQQATYSQQQAAITSSKGGWIGIITALTAVAGLFVTAFVVIGSMALSPIRDAEAESKSDIHELVRTSVKDPDYKLSLVQQQNRNLAVEASVEKVRNTIGETGLVLAELKGHIDERQLAYLRDLTETKLAIHDIDASLIKRPEIEAANKSQDQRSDALSQRLNQLQGTLDTIFPANEVIKEMQSRLNQLTYQPNSQQQPLIAPLVAPVVPHAQ